MHESTLPKNFHLPLFPVFEDKWKSSFSLLNFGFKQRNFSPNYLSNQWEFFHAILTVNCPYALLTPLVIIPSKRLHKATFPLSPNPHSQSQIRSHMPKYSVPLKPLPLERRVEYRAADFLKFFNCLTRRLDRLGSRGKRPALSSTSLPCSPSSLQKMDRGIQTEQFQSSFLE